MKSEVKNIQSNEDKWVFLASMFEREGACVAETELTVTLNGVYSVPEEWHRLEASGAVDAWPWQVKVSDINFTEGKTNPRELSENEKKEIDAKKNPKKPGKNNELTPQEIERQEKERVEREEKEKKYQDEWNSLDELGKFYKKKETPTEESWISFPHGKHVMSITKSGEKLLEIEDEINTEKGFLLEFFKIPPADEDPKKRPKPKNISPEEVKPINCISWIDLSEFHNHPGLSEITLRSPLMLKETFERKIQLEEELDQAISEGHDTAEIHTQIVSLTDYVMQKKSYIYLKIHFSVPINPEVPEKPIPSPYDLIKKDDKPFKQIMADEICNDFRKQLKIAIAAISKQYEDFMGDAKNNLIKRDKANVMSNAKKEERDSNITKFMINFNISGRAELLKEKLKKFIVRIVREKYRKRTTVKGIFKDEKDQFYSELFAYLTDEVKLAMDEFVFLKKDELHEHITSSYEQSRKEVMQYALRINKEPEEKRLLRLSNEYEIMDDMNKALFYYKSRLTLNQTKETWSTYAMLTKKMGLVVDTEEAIVNCLEIEPDDMNFKILYSAVKFLKNRSNDAINFLLAIIEEMKGVKFTNCNLNAFLAFLFKEASLNSKDKMKDLLYKKHWESALRFKMKELGMVQYLGKRTSKLKTDNKKLTDEQKDQISDQIYFNLCNFFNSYYMFEISEKLLECQISQKNSIKYKLELAKILLNKRDYNKVIELTNEIVAVEKNNYLAWVLRGNSYFFKQDLYNSEESYVRAIRCKSDRSERFDIKMLYRLGMTYINRTTWKDAKTVFLQILKENPGYSFAWGYLGFSLMKLGEYSSAEEAFNEANLLDVENPRIWAYLCIYCITVGRKYQAFECLNELMKLQFIDVKLLEEIGDLFSKNGELNLTCEIYNKIISHDSNNIRIYFKLAGVYSQMESKKGEAMELLKNKLKTVEDENDRKKIMKFMDYLNKEVGLSPKNDVNISYRIVDHSMGEDEIKGGGDSLSEENIFND